MNSSFLIWFLNFLGLLKFNFLFLEKGSLSIFSNFLSDFIGFFLIFETSIKCVSLRTLSIIIRFLGFTKCASGIPISFLSGL